MEYILFPISLFTKSIISKGPLISQSIPFFFMVFALVYVLYEKKKYLFFKVNFKSTLFVFITLLAQVISIFNTSLRVHSEISQTAGLLNGTVSVLFTVFIAVVIYFVAEGMLDSDEKINNYFKSIVVSLCVYLVVILLPQVYATVSYQIDGYLNLIGKFFEQRHVGRNDFYNMGSYVTTMRRVNGLMPEAGFMAALLGISFIPTIVAAIVTRYDIFSKRKTNVSYVSYWVLLIMTFVVLFFAKTSTGFLVIGLTAGCLFIFSSVRDKKVYLVIGILMLVLLAALYMKSKYLQDLLNGYLLNKKGTSNRVGGTIALFRTFLHYPLIGVGMGFTSPYVFRYVPFDTTVNNEFITVFAGHGYADQSVWGEWTAYFGLLIILPVLYYIYKKVKTTIKIYHNIHRNGVISNRFYYFIIVSFWVYLVNVSVISIFSYEWNHCIYLLTFFIYVVAINHIAPKMDVGVEGESNDRNKTS